MYFEDQPEDTKFYYSTPIIATSMARNLYHELPKLLRNTKILPPRKKNYPLYANHIRHLGGLVVVSLSVMEKGIVIT